MSKVIFEIIFNDGVILFVIGFGIYKFNGNEGVNVIMSVIDVGYCLIDIVYNYENEGIVG